MRSFAMIALAAAGVLLLLVPSLVFPVCEYRGFPRMHCSDTAFAEYLIGLLFLSGAVSLFLMDRPHMNRIVAGAALLLCGFAYASPDIFGYCKSSQMPCNHGTVPALRIIAIVTAAAMAVSLASFLRGGKGRNWSV